ncbi:hypothetical protein M2263_003693 [Providencia alcalifaciens]|nr:hypothetical protein [Providencia alcalifaciens]
MTNVATQSVNTSIEMNSVEVTKKINFVWLGKLGSIQQDYIRVWKKLIQIIKLLFGMTLKHS